MWNLEPSRRKLCNDVVAPIDNIDIQFPSTEIGISKMPVYITNAAAADVEFCSFGTEVV